MSFLFYHLLVHCHRNNIQTVFGKIGGNTLWRKINKIHFYRKSRYPWWWEYRWCVLVMYVRPVGSSAARRANYGSPPRAPQYGLNTNVGTCSCRTVCSAPLGDTRVFLCPKLCDTLCFYRENMNHKAPIAFAVYPLSIWFDLWNSTFNIIYPILHYADFTKKIKAYYLIIICQLPLLPAFHDILIWMWVIQHLLFSWWNPIKLVWFPAHWIINW